MNIADELIDETCAVVLAGGKGERLGALTRDVCKPALPFGGAHRNIDFSLSNCLNSGIRRIGVATQYKPQVLLRHLESVWSGRVTGPDQFIAAWPAETHAPAWGYRGTADAVFRNLDIIESTGCRRVLVLAGDHVYKMDYRPLIAYHRACRADVTVGCVKVPVEEARQFGILSMDNVGRVDGFIEKPKTVDGLAVDAGHCVLASMGVYVFEAEFLARALKCDARRNGSGHDFGADILPRLIRAARVFGYTFNDAPNGVAAYWRDVGTPSAYWRAHMDLLGPCPALRLDDVDWPIACATGATISTTRYSGVGRNESTALIGSDCDIRGVVRHSVLFPGVAIGADAEVANSLILPGAAIGNGCRLRGVIVDSDCRVPDGTVIECAWPNASKANQAEPVVLTAEYISATVPEIDRPMIASA